MRFLLFDNLAQGFLRRLKNYIRCRLTKWFCLSNIYCLYIQLYSPSYSCTSNEMSQLFSTAAFQRFRQSPTLCYLCYLCLCDSRLSIKPFSWSLDSNRITSKIFNSRRTQGICVMLQHLYETPSSEINFEFKMFSIIIIRHNLVCFASGLLFGLPCMSTASRIGRVISMSRLYLSAVSLFCGDISLEYTSPLFSSFLLEFRSRVNERQTLNNHTI